MATGCECFVLINNNFLFFQARSQTNDGDVEKGRDNKVNKVPSGH